MAFYKFDNGILSSGTFISGFDESGNGYELFVGGHENNEYPYPYYGWYWFDTEEEANVFFNIGYV